MNKNIAIVVGIVAIVGIGIFVFSGDNTANNEITGNDTVKEQIMDTESERVMAEKEEVLIDKKDDFMVEKDESAMMDKKDEVTVVDKDDAMAQAGSYMAYSAEKIAMAETGDVVIFFHATWCPSCRALNTDIESNVSAIPDGVTILKTDYDKETELKKKYGVTTQHTLVQVDKEGNLIKKWSGGSKLENLLSQIQ